MPVENCCNCQLGMKQREEFACKIKTNRLSTCQTCPTLECRIGQPPKLVACPNQCGIFFEVKDYQCNVEKVV